MVDGGRFAAQTKKRNRPAGAGGLADVARLTARVWRRRVSSYNDAITVGALVRAQLGLHRPPSWGRRPLERLEPSELRRLLDAAYARRGVDGLICKTLLLTGCRVAELCALEVGDLRLELREIIIRHGKGDKARTVPILPGLANELAVHLAGRRRGPVFVSTWGRWKTAGGRPRPYSERRIQQIIRELAAAAGIEKRVHPHLMRHTIAQHLLDHGMPIEQLQGFLGHARIDTTTVYARATAGAIRAGYGRALEKGPIDGG